MSLSRRDTLKSAAGLLAATALPGAFAQAAYPNTFLKVVIPTSVGGGHDSMMRVVGEKLTQAWGQPLVVESKAGASGAIAATTVAKAAPDGYTMLLNYSAMVSNLVLHKDPGYKLADFKPVCMLVLTPIAIGVRASLGIKTLKEFVALAKSKPGKVSYGSYGQGSGGNFVGELLNETAGIDTIHLPYKGEAPAIQDLLGGQIDAAVVSLGGVSRHPGKIVPLAVASDHRFPVYADVPTFAEAGFPAVVMPGWGGVFVPAATPQPIVDKLSAELTRIIMLPDVSKKMLDLGFESVGWPADKLQAFMQQQLGLIKRLVDGGRIKL